MIRFRSTVLARYFVATGLLAGCADDSSAGSSGDTGSSTGATPTSTTASTASTTSTTTAATDPGTSSGSEGTTTDDPETTSSGMDTTTTGPDTDTDTDTTGTGPTETTGTSEDTGEPIACAAECVAAAPKGWQGPVARVPSEGIEEDSACGGNYPDTATVGFQSLTAPAPACACACGAPANGACNSAINVDIYDVECSSVHATGFCQTFGANWNACDTVDTTLSAGPVEFVADDDWGIRIAVDPAAIAQNPTCPPLDTSTIGAFETSEFFEICAPPAAEDGTCMAGDVCMPAITNPFLAGFCVWTDGDVECPADTPYTAKELLFDAVADTRACSPCGCGNAQGVACDGEVSVVVSYNTGAPLDTFDPAEVFPASEMCSSTILSNGIPTGDVTYTVNYTAESPTATTCASSGGSASGTATAQGAKTVCCAP